MFNKIKLIYQKICVIFRPWKMKFLVNDLIPVRIDTEIAGHKYQDKFCWNRNEPQFTPNILAKMIVDENNLD